jgi:photosystem II stability/assembly factor-like uncharacterized protein
VATEHGVFRTTNGGAHWEPASQGLPTFNINGFVFHPTKSDVVYALPDGNRSVDSGKTWNDGLKTGYPFSTGLGIVFGKTARTIYSAGALKLVVSTDKGHSWRVLYSVSGLNGTICTLNVIAGATDVIYLGRYTSDGSELLRSEDGGESWELTSLGGCPQSLNVSNPRNLQATMGGVAYHSADGGATWDEYPNIPLGSVGAIEVLADEPTLMYAVGSSDDGTASSVAKTEDGGATWSKIWHGPWGLSLSLDPLNRDVVLGGDFRGVLRSDDGGGSFHSINEGLSATTPTTIAFSPDNPRTMFVTTWLGLYRSNDGGQSWSDIGQELADPNPNRQTHFSSVAVDAAGRVYTPTYRYNPPVAELYRSSDNGESWEKLPDVLTAEVLPHPTDPDRLLATSLTGVVISLDGGQSWQPSSIPPYVGVDLELDEVTGTVYVLTGQDVYEGNASEKTLFKSDSFGEDWIQLPYPPVRQTSNISALSNVLYTGSSATSEITRSTDGGNTWTKLVVNPGNWPSSIRGVAIDPLDPNQVAISSDDLGVLFSRDRGQTWDLVQSYYRQPGGVVAFFPATSEPSTTTLDEQPLLAGLGGVWQITPGPNPRHEARIEERVEAGNIVTCRTGPWSRTETVSYAWFNGSGDRYFGAFGPTFRVPKPKAPNFDVYCRATGKGPGGTYRSTSDVHPIRR